MSPTANAQDSFDKSSADVTICRPGGPLIYGRVSVDVAEALRHHRQIKPLRIWYRCISCNRTIRLEDELDHNKSYHTLVTCSTCHQKVDHFHLGKHQRETCSKIKTFCEFCSSQSTLEGIEAHYTECSEAKKLKELGSFSSVISPLQNITLSDFVAKDLVQIAQSVLNSTSQTENFPAKVLAKYKGPFGYKLYSTEVKEGDEKVTKNEKLKRRQNDQLQLQKRVVTNYLVKKLIPPQEKIQRQIQSYWLNREAEVKLTKAALSSIVKESRHEEERIPSVNKKYTRAVHDYTASLCRQHARRQSDHHRRQAIISNIIKLNRVQQRKVVKEDQNYVISQAIKLEQNKEKVEKIHFKNKPAFLDDLKAERPVWPDLGL